MLLRLTHRIRVRTGRLLALVYLLCVLAPAAALAVGDPAPCFIVETQASIVKAGDTAAAHHGHRAGSHDHGGKAADHRHAKHDHGGNTSSGPCCAMLCLSAMTAELPAIAKPRLPNSFLVTADFRPLRGKAPPLLYRPPIA